MSRSRNPGEARDPKARCGGGRKTLEGDRERKNCQLMSCQEGHKTSRQGQKGAPREGPCQPGSLELLTSVTPLAIWGNGVPFCRERQAECWSTKPVRPTDCGCSARSVPWEKGKIQAGRRAGKQETPVLCG